MSEKGSSGAAISGINNWIAGGEEEDLHIMTDEEIISNGLEDDNGENKQESCTPPPIIRTSRVPSTHVINGLKKITCKLKASSH
jgi:hypothetical protein